MPPHETGFGKAGGSRIFALLEDGADSGVCVGCAIADIAGWISDLQIEHRLAFGVISSLDDLSGLILVGGAEAGSFAGGFIRAIEHPATDAPVG